MSTQREDSLSAPSDSNALVLSPSFEAAEWESCGSFLYPDRGGENAVITVAYNETPESVVERWRGSGGPPPTRFGAVFAGGESMNSRALTRRLREAFDEEDVMAGAAVVSPGNLTQIDIEVSEMLGMWDAEGTRVALCIDSLTTLLQYSSITRVFKFLHTTIASFKAAEATTSTHYHLDPGTVNDRDLARVRSLMDEVVDVRAGSSD